MTQTVPGNKPNLVPIGTVLAGACALAVVALWAFWPTLAELGQKWIHDPQYSHGILVPLFAAYMLWVRREHLRGDLSPAVLAGGGCLLLAGASRVVSGVLCFTWIDAMAILPCLIGMALLVGGRAAFRWCWPAVAFLFFMIPLPYSIEIALGGPLQRVATLGSAFMLQALGQPAVAEGNTIMLNDVKLGIVEACSGLRMLVTFFTFSTGMAMLIRKPWLEKMCIVLSAIPIALLTNIIRITATGIMYQNHREFAHVFFHDLAGWFMMPVCLGFLGIELWILNKLIIDGRQAKPLLALR